MLNVKTALLLTFGLCMLINETSSKRVVCYYTNWAQYRKEAGKFVPEDIDPNLCTHIIYSFAKVNGASELEAYEWNDESTSYSKGNYQKVIDFKASNPNLKVMVAVGGWNHGSGPFSDMVTDPSLRQKFVRTAVTFLTKNKFDGLDLDWEYPASNPGSRPTDKHLFTTLIKELKAAFASKNLLLSAAVSIGKSTIDKAYEVSKISQNLDFINLMAYDFHGSWENFLGFNAPLYSNDQLSVDYAVKYWISSGASPDKLNLGLGSYGRSFKKSTQSNIVGSPASGPGASAKFTGEPGVMSYYEICENIKVNGWTEAYDSTAQVPFAYKGDQWVGYDNVKSIKLKADYASSKGLGGIMFWTLDEDDFKGTFCGEGTYPLIRAGKSAFSGSTLVTSGPSIVTTGQPSIVATQQSLATTKQTAILQTITTTATTGSVLRCFRGDGFYANVESGCKKFYQCVYSGTIWEKSVDQDCPSGLLFDSSVKVCNWPSLVICKA